MSGSKKTEKFLKKGFRQGKFFGIINSCAIFYDICKR